MKLNILNKIFYCLNYFFSELFTFFGLPEFFTEKILSSCYICCKCFSQFVVCLSNLFIVTFGELKYLILNRLLKKSSYIHLLRLPQAPVSAINILH